MVVKGWSAIGCTHHFPAFANRTICCPGRAPTTRPAIVANSSGPPSSACGITLNSIDGLVSVGRGPQPLKVARSANRATFRMNPQRALDRGNFIRTHPWGFAVRTEVLKRSGFIRHTFTIRVVRDRGIISEHQEESSGRWPKNGTRHKGTKPHEAGNSTVYIFVLLRVFVPSWLFQFTL